MTEPTAPFTPTLSVTPAEAEVAAGAEQRFQAHINYPPGVRYIRQPVEWRVLEEHGGTVNPGGLYTAPGKPGTYHVEARRQDFPKVCATATVTVP